MTTLECIGTSQSHIPYLLKQNRSDASSWAMLPTCNLLFVLPLAMVLVCFHRGVERKALLGWSKRNLVVVKILSGFFFTAMVIRLLSV